MGPQLSVPAADRRVDRRAFTAQLIAAVGDALVVTGLGSPSYDAFAAGDRDLNFYLWGAMGSAVPIGLGLALAQPTRSVVVLTGDGEQLMGVGALATAAVQRPANLTIVVLDNGHFGETGMQPSHTSLATDLAAVARGFGIDDARVVDDLEQVPAIAGHITERAGLLFVRAVIEIDEPPRALPRRDGTYLKNRFRAALGLEPF